MKQTKKFLSLLLTFVMVLTLTNGLTVKAEDTQTGTITVTLRVEQDEATLVAPAKVTLTEEDLKNDYGLQGLNDETLTPLHALAKYMKENCGATSETMEKYIQQSNGFVNGISTKGEIATGSENESEQNPNAGSPSVSNRLSAYGIVTYWMIGFNNYTKVLNPESENGYDYSAGDYPLKDGDVITFYGAPSFYNISDEASFYYTVFDKAEYSAKTNEAVTVNLKGKDPMDYSETAYDEVDHPIEDAEILVAQRTDEVNSVTGETADASYGDIHTDMYGNASITFTKAGTYVLSASRTNIVEVSTGDESGTKEGVTYCDISRPYAIVTVEDSQVKEEQTPAATSTPTPAPTTAANSKADETSVSKPAQVKKVKKSIAKKFKNNKKTVVLSWKKTKASGYQIYLSKKTKKGFKKKAATTKTKKTLKLKKGTYYVKVRAYNKSGSKVAYGKFSKVVKVKVK